MFRQQRLGTKSILEHIKVKKDSPAAGGVWGEFERGSDAQGTCSKQRKDNNPEAND